MKLPRGRRSHLSSLIPALVAAVFAFGASAQTDAPDGPDADALDRVQGPLDCRPSVAGEKRCLALLPSGAKPLYLKVRDEKGEKVERDYVRFSTDAARDLGYTERTLVLFDGSLSAGRESQRHKAVIVAAAKALVRAAGDGGKVSVAAFGEEVREISREGVAEGEAAIDALSTPDTSTFLFGAVVQAAARLEGAQATRKHILLLSDGLSEDRLVRYQAAVEAAQNAGVSIDAFGLMWQKDGSDARSRGREALKQLARQTGGVYGELDLAAGETIDSSDILDRLSDRRRQSGYVNITGLFDSATVELTVEGGDGFSEESVFRAGIDLDCDESRTLEECRTAPPPSFEEPDSGDLLVNDDIFGLGVDDTYVMIGAGVGGGLLVAALLFFALRGGRADDEEDLEDSDTDSESDVDIITQDEPLQAVGGAAASGDDATRGAVPSGDAPTQMSAPHRGRLVRADRNDTPPFELRSDRISIGRADDNDLVLRHDSISRSHASIHFDPRSGGLVITDLNSMNHVYVNGARVQTSPLTNQDVIRLGEVELRYEAG